MQVSKPGKRSSNLQPKLGFFMDIKYIRIVCGVLGLVPIFIGMRGMFFGLEYLIPGADITSGPDGQYRYFSAIYLGFGGLILWIQSRLDTEVQLFRILISMVFVAGVARAAAFFVYGLPETSIILATAFELVFPPVLIMWHGMVVKANARL